MKTSKSLRKVLTGAALFMLFASLFTGCPQKIKEKKVSVTGIKLDKTELELGVNESKKLSPIFKPLNASNKKLTWASDKPEIAAVDKDGNVTGKTEGTAVITVTTEDGGKTVNCTETKLKHGIQTILHATGDKIILKGAIVGLYCKYNQLTKEVFTKIFQYVPNRPAGNEGYCYLYTENTNLIEENYTDFTEDELNVIKPKNRTPYKINSYGNREEL